jgi:hypothetical protein
MALMTALFFFERGAFSAAGDRLPPPVTHAAAAYLSFVKGEPRRHR